MKLMRRRSDGGIFPWTESLAKNPEFDLIPQAEADEICKRNAERSGRQLIIKPAPVKKETLLEVEAAVSQEMTKAPADDSDNISVIGEEPTGSVENLPEPKKLTNTELNRASREKLVEYAFIRFGEKFSDETVKKDIIKKIAELEAARGE